jgi:hypothetical protein
VVVVVSRSPKISDPLAVVGPPQVSIGDSGSEELHEVVGALRLADGRIVIADAGNAVILYFSPEGRLLASVGRKGDGPSEFRTLQAIGKAAGDTVWVYDFSHHRLTFISPEIAVVGEITLRPPAGPALAVGVLPDRTIVVGEAWSPGVVATATEPGLNRERVAYLRYSSTGELMDTVGLFLGREVILSLEDGRAVMGAAPMARSAAHALSGPWLAIGDQVRHEIRLVAPSGALHRIIRWDGGDLSVDPELEARWRAARLASVPREQRPTVGRRLAEQEMPAQRPAYGRILPSEAGGLWVGDYAIVGEEPAAWTVFDPAGEWQGSVPMPHRFRPLDVGRGWILGVSRDELDVQRVELRPLGPDA